MTETRDRQKTHDRQRNGIAHLVCGRRAKWLVLVLWLVVLFLTAPFASRSSPTPRTTRRPPGCRAPPNPPKSWRSRRTSGPSRSPRSSIYARESGLTAEDRTRIAEDVRQLKELSDHGIRGAQTRGPVFDRGTAPRAAQVFVPITMDEKGWERIAPAVDSIREETGESAGGLAVHITGPGGTSADFSEAFEGIDSTLLLAAMGVVIVMLLFTYRSPTLLLVPLLAVIVALFTAQALIYLLAEHAGLTVNGQSAGILTVLVFGAGTDYALLLVARYREELRRHEDRHEAMALALHRAGPAVIASGATVVLSMLVLLAAEMNSTSGLGPVAAIGVAVALLAMMTLFPALLVIFGRWIFWPVIPHYGTADPAERGVWARTGRGIARRPRMIWGVTAAALALCSLGLLQLRAEGISNADAFTGKPDSVVGQEVSERYFPAGSGDPLVIISNRAQAEEVGRAVAGTRGVVPESLGLPPGTKPAHEGKVLFEATMSDPADSEAAKQTVERVRDAVHEVPDADAQVGGGTAALLDMDKATTHDNILIIPLVLLVVLLILCALLRALIAPLLLIGDGDPVLHRRSGHQRARVPVRLRLRGRVDGLPAVRLRVPGGPGHRLQHLPDHPHPRGGRPPGHPPGRGDGPGGDGRGHHLRRPGPGRHLRRPRHAPDGRLRRDRLRGGPGRAAGHLRRTVGPGHGAVPGRGPEGVVAAPAGAGGRGRPVRESAAKVTRSGG